MSSNYLEFKKRRDFGELISDTFTFVRLQFKPFLAAIIKITGPFMLLTLLGFAVYFYGLRSVTGFYVDFDETATYNLIVLLIGFMIMLIFGVITYVLMASTTIHFIKSYIEGKGVADFKKVLQEVKGSFMGFLGLGILKILMLFFGFMLCFIPGIYLLAPLYIVFCIKAFDQKTATNSIEYSFKLVKDEWWITFLFILVMGIIQYISSLVFSLPATIYMYIKMGIIVTEIDPQNPTSLFDPVYLVLNLVSTAFQFFLNLISVVASVLVYFNLNERKNFSGAYERIDKLGDSLNDNA